MSSLINTLTMEAVSESSLSLGVPSRKGKVCNIYDLNSHLLLGYTDRLSAFDKHVCDVPGKGLILANINRWWLEKTRHIIPNHFVCQTDNKLLVEKCQPIPLEIIVRGYITGNTSTSLWTHYEKGERLYCGITFPDGLKKNQKLDTPVVTPTTKSDVHDELISPKEILDQGILTSDEWQFIRDKALELYKFGVDIAKEKGLILVDTKYEFGKRFNGEIILIDEIHTCDSSRYWEFGSWNLGGGHNPEKLDKDIARDALINNNLKLDVFVEKLSTEYKNFYNRVCNNNEVIIIYGSPSDMDHVDKLRSHLDKYHLSYDYYCLSAHKKTKELLNLLKGYEKFDSNIVYITVAGRSNALSGVVACNTRFPVIACPPFQDKVDMLVNINSTLQMPSYVPVMTVLEPLNAVLAANKIFSQSNI